MGIDFGGKIKTRARKNLPQGFRKGERHRVKAKIKTEPGEMSCYKTTRRSYRKVIFQWLSSGEEREASWLRTQGQRTREKKVNFCQWRKSRPISLFSAKVRHFSIIFLAIFIFIFSNRFLLLRFFTKPRYLILILPNNRCMTQNKNGSLGEWIKIWCQNMDP